MKQLPPVSGGLITRDSPLAITHLRIRQGMKSFSIKNDLTNWTAFANYEQTMHQHSYLELIYVLNGEMTQHLENGVFRYQAGDAMLLNRNIRHYEGDETDCDIVFLCLDPNFLRDTLLDNRVHPGILQSNIPNVMQFLNEHEQPNSAAVREYLDFAFSLEHRQKPEQIPGIELLSSMQKWLHSRAPGYAYRLQADLIQLFSLLGTSQYYHVSRIRVDADEEAFIYTRVLRFLEERHGHASRAELGAALHYSGDYLNRLVKRQCGKTILQLGQDVCMHQAARLLKETDLPISTIIEQLGLVSRSHFYRTFTDKMGCLPTEYRKKT